MPGRLAVRRRRRRRCSRCAAACRLLNAYRTTPLHTRTQFFHYPTPHTTGPQLDVPQGVTPAQLETLLNGLLQNDEKMPYSFYIEEQVGGGFQLVACWLIALSRCSCGTRIPAR
jgi:hypothetical protein